MTRSRYLLPPRRFWSPDEVDVLRRRYPDESTAAIAATLGRDIRGVYAKASALSLRKSATFLAGPLAYRLDGIIGTATRFKPGQVPPNKGLRRPGYGPGRMKETQFKSGQVSKRWDPDIYTVGALRITSDNTLQIKLAEGNRQWVKMSRYVWRLHTGDWPRAVIVVRSRNGDPHDTRFENLELLTLRQNMLRNSVHAVLPPELARLVQLQGAIKQQINRRLAA